MINKHISIIPKHESCGQNINIPPDEQSHVIITIDSPEPINDDVVKIKEPQIPHNGVVLMTSSLADVLSTCHEFIRLVETLCSTVYITAESVAHQHARVELLGELFVVS